MNLSGILVYFARLDCLYYSSQLDCDMMTIFTFVERSLGLGCVLCFSRIVWSSWCLGV